VWLSRYAVAVHRLTRGIGDTMFYGADGQPWFRLDEQRHDVSLDDISADLQHAVVAVEHRVADAAREPVHGHRVPRQPHGGDAGRHDQPEQQRERDPLGESTRPEQVQERSPFFSIISE
jgi:hypothetical protein